jgi:hypothetical protein
MSRTLLLQRTIWFSYGIKGYDAITRAKIQTGSKPIPNNKTPNRLAVEHGLVSKLKLPIIVKIQCLLWNSMVEYCKYSNFHEFDQLPPSKSSRNILIIYHLTLHLVQYECHDNSASTEHVQLTVATLITNSRNYDTYLLDCTASIQMHGCF